MTLDEQQEEYVHLFSMLGDELDRYDYLLNRALSEGAAFDEQIRQDANRIQGCQSNLWVDITMEAGLVKVRCDSDALIVKGLAGMIAELFSGRKPEEVLSTSMWFLDEIGLGQLLGERRIGLGKIAEEIRAYALKQLDKSE